MKPFLRKNFSRGGFSLIEVTLSIGILSFGVLSLIPLMALGLKSARLAREERAAAHIAQTLIDETKEGTTPAAMLYLNSDGNPADPSAASYRVESTVQPVPGSSLSRLTLRVIPTGSPDHARTYAVLLNQS